MSSTCFLNAAITEKGLHSFILWLFIALKSSLVRAEQCMLGQLSLSQPSVQPYTVRFAVSVVLGFRPLLFLPFFFFFYPP